MSKQIKFPKLTILGLEVDIISITDSIAYIRQLVGKPKAHYVVKPYVEFVEAAQKNPQLLAQLNAADLCLPDGVALKWAAYFERATSRHWWDVITSGAKIVLKPERLRQVIPDHFAGTYFTWPLLEMCARTGLSVYLVGSPHRRSIDHTALFLRQRLPKLKIAGTQTGRDPKTGLYSPALEQALLHDLKRLKPDVVLFGLNFHAYVPLMAGLSAQLKHGVLIGEGGTFDFDNFGGVKRKAPHLVHRLGLEWLWRLGREPKRIRRQVAIPRFIWRVYRSQKRP